MNNNLEIITLWATADEDGGFIDVSREKGQVVEWLKEDEEAQQIIQGFGVINKTTNLMPDNARDFHYDRKEAEKELASFMSSIQNRDQYRTKNANEKIKGNFITETSDWSAEQIAIAVNKQQEKEEKQLILHGEQFEAAGEEYQVILFCSENLTDNEINDYIQNLIKAIETNRVS